MKSLTQYINESLVGSISGILLGCALLCAMECGEAVVRKFKNKKLDKEHYYDNVTINGLLELSNKLKYKYETDSKLKKLDCLNWDDLDTIETLSIIKNNEELFNTRAIDICWKLSRCELTAEEKTTLEELITRLIDGLQHERNSKIFLFKGDKEKRINELEKIHNIVKNKKAFK